jgi:hypothetical protein
MAKTSIGKAWAKIFHTEAIPGVKADNPYFVVVVKETQRWGNQIILLKDRRRRPEEGVNESQSKFLNETWSMS